MNIQQTSNYESLKLKVMEFWNTKACGEVWLPAFDVNGFQKHSEIRYKLEPFIIDFAKFSQTKGLKVLEIGVGIGADHQKFAESGADLYGIDLTPRAIEITRNRLKLFGLKSNLTVGDAENLNFPNEYFDLVYSWGVLHHTPDIKKAISEIHRVLKSNGIAKVMIYNKWSINSLLLWLRYALLNLQPWKTIDDILANYLESPGTRGFTIKEARELFSIFKKCKIKIVLSEADLLDKLFTSKSNILRMISHFWPRNIIKRFFKKYGFYILIEAQK